MSLAGRPLHHLLRLLSFAAPFAVLMLTAAGPARKVTTRPMFKVEEHTAFYVVGLARRTNNAREMGGLGEIGKVWQEFMQKNLAAEITHKLDDDLLAVYTDYESNQTGDYTFLLGKRASDLRDLPAGLTGRYVPEGRYAVLVSEEGPVAQVVPRLWQRVWSLSPIALGGRRAFAADYEIYDQRAKNPQNAQVELHLGIQ